MRTVWNSPQGLSSISFQLSGVPAKLLGASAKLELSNCAPRGTRFTDVLIASREPLCHIVPGWLQDVYYVVTSWHVSTLV
jgi:hypothetical protein